MKEKRFTSCREYIPELNDIQSGENLGVAYNRGRQSMTSKVSSPASLVQVRQAAELILRCPVELLQASDYIVDHKGKKGE